MEEGEVAGVWGETLAGEKQEGSNPVSCKGLDCILYLAGSRICVLNEHKELSPITNI